MPKNTEILGKIVEIANELDKGGYPSEADRLDDVLSKAYPSGARIIKIPDIRQYNEYSCGSACLLALLSYWGVYEGNEKALAKRLGTNHKDGTSSQKIAAVARDYGLKAAVKHDCDISDLRDALDNSNPPIVNFQAWSDKKVTDWSDRWADGHYAICVGIDDDHIYLRDPVIYNKTGYISIDSFQERWHDVGDDKKPIYRMAIFISGDSPDGDDSLTPVE